MNTITVEEAQVQFEQLIDQLAPGEGLVITRNAQPIARLTGFPSQAPHPVPGRGRGKLVILAEDDEHLADWRIGPPRTRVDPNPGSV